MDSLLLSSTSEAVPRRRSKLRANSVSAQSVPVQMCASPGADVGTVGLAHMQSRQSRPYADAEYCQCPAQSVIDPGADVARTARSSPACARHSSPSCASRARGWRASGPIARNSNASAVRFMSHHTKPRHTVCWTRRRCGVPRRYQSERGTASRAHLHNQWRRRFLRRAAHGTRERLGGIFHGTRDPHRPGGALKKAAMKALRQPRKWRFRSTWFC